MHTPAGGGGAHGPEPFGLVGGKAGQRDPPQSLVQEAGSGAGACRDGRLAHRRRRPEVEHGIDLLLDGQHRPRLARQRHQPVTLPRHPRAVRHEGGEVTGAQ
jgi:hypothetical protein